MNLRKLSNGIRLITIPKKDSPSATVAVLVEAGASYENKKNNGVSHFLEHMCFKGTQKRQNPSDISSELEKLGAIYNAFTSRDVTGYYAKVAYPKLKDAVEIISDMYVNPLFKEEEIKKEKGVIIEEINMYEDDPKDKVALELEKNMYGDQPSGWDIAGTKKTVSEISREELISYRKRNYICQKTIVAVSGNFDEKEIIKFVENCFKGIQSGKKEKSEKVFDFNPKDNVQLTNKKVDQVHIAIGMKTFSALSDKKYELMVMSDILGGGMSSRLFKRIREDMGAAYYIGVSPNLYATHGYLGIFAGLNKEKFYVATKAIYEEMQKMADKKVFAEELSKAKDHLIGTFLLSLETSDQLAFFYGNQEAVSGQIESAEEIIRKIRSVNESKILSLSRNIFNPKNISVSIVGSGINKNKIGKLLC